MLVAISNPDKKTWFALFQIGETITDYFRFRIRRCNCDWLWEGQCLPTKQKESTRSLR